MDLRLKDKAVLIPGPSRGIGLASAKAFAAEGCRIVLSARSAGGLAKAEASLRAGGATIAARAADLTRPEQAAQLVEAAVPAFGGVDILVNNVGGGEGGPHIANSTDDDWRAVFELNLVQSLRMMRLALWHMSGRAGAAVINVASISGWVAAARNGWQIRGGQGGADLRHRALGAGVCTARHRRRPRADAQESSSAMAF